MMINLPTDSGFNVEVHTSITLVSGNLDAKFCCRNWYALWYIQGNQKEVIDL